jgi:hypothetical protein
MENYIAMQMRFTSQYHVKSIACFQIKIGAIGAMIEYQKKKQAASAS